MRKVPGLTALRNRGFEADYFEPGVTRLEGEGTAIRVCQRDHIRIVALPFHFERLPIPESKCISRAAQQNIVNPGAVEIVNRVQNHHIVEGDRLPGQAIR